MHYLTTARVAARLLAAAAVLASAALSAAHAYAAPGQVDPAPLLPAGVTHGAALAWRVLEQAGPELPPDGRWGRIDAGNFDADADGELLLRLDSGHWLLEAGGARRQLDYPQFTGGGTAARAGRPWFQLVWDYDGDGVDDLLCSEFERGAAEDAGRSTAGLSDHMAAYALDGRRLGRVGGVPMGPWVARPDFDGDGRPELLMDTEGDYGAGGTPVRAFGPGGAVLFEAASSWSMDMTWADLDGDGRDELIDLGAGGRGTLQALGPGGNVRQLAVGAADADALWQGHATGLDLNGDGRDELVHWEGAVFDLAAGARWRLAAPAGYATPLLAGGPALFLMDGGDGSCCALQFAGQPALAALIGKGAAEEQTLAVWDYSGALLYAENLGERARDMAVLRAGGVDHLVVLTRTRLLIAP